MFPTSTTRRPNTRSLRELVRTAVSTAVEFATLGEATVSSRLRPAEPPAPVARHPHRRPLGRRRQARRPLMAAPRPQVCTASPARGKSRRAPVA